MESRILRPSLAADHRPTSQSKAPTPPETPSYAAKAATPQPAPPAGPSPAALPKKKTKNLASKALRSPAIPNTETTGISNVPATSGVPQVRSTKAVHSEDKWQTVGNKKKASKKKRDQAKKSKKAAKKLRTPRSTAVVLTLQPAAQERGATYAELLKKARAAIDPGKLGITAGLKCKVTQTGARLIEVPGATSSDIADRLAEGLRQILPSEDVRVSRPQKCADLRIVGLDDSVTTDEVIAAVSKVGECLSSQVSCSTIRQGRAGMGTAIVKCPVASAKKLADGRRLLVGWVSAQVKLLESRPSRCYRCLSSGHLGVKCTSDIDCSGRCFRCGQPGHTAATCEASPHCILCAAAGKPDKHRAGGKDCATSKKSSQRGKSTSLGRSARKTVASLDVGAGENMETK